MGGINTKTSEISHIYLDKMTVIRVQHGSTVKSKTALLITFQYPTCYISTSL